MNTNFCELLGYTFKNCDLLEKALTHKSYFNEHNNKSIGHNERLEFLGDSVLDLSLSNYLMSRFDELDEGELSKVRASLVNEATLADLALELGIEKYIHLGKGEFRSGGAMKPRLLACAFEAVIGAIFQDSNFECVDQIIQKIFQSRIENLDLQNHFKSDYKTRLQEKMQSLLRQTPNYELEREEGPDHDKIFYVNLKLEDRVISQGTGRSKKQAEQDAARIALESL